MQFITDFADQAVLLPLAVLIGVGWVAGGWRRGAIIWALCVGGVLGFMLVAKLIVLGCGFGHLWDIHSPSGHTAGAAMIYGGLAAIVLRRWVPLAPAVALGALPPALLAAATRLALHVHTLSDVGCGAVVGLAGALVFARLAGAMPRIGRGFRPVLAAALLMLLLHGHRAEAEPRILWLAHHFWPFSACAD